MGHEDSRTTPDVYEQDLDDSDYAVELLEGVLGCEPAEAHGVSPGRETVAERERPPRRAWRGSSPKRLKGLEPSTFCMASSHELGRIRTKSLQKRRIVAAAPQGGLRVHSEASG